MLCKPGTGQSTHMFPKWSKSEWRRQCSTFLLQKSSFFKGVGEIRRRAKGRSGKIMEKSGEIKIGNERNGLLCTETCKNAPNWVLDEKKVNNQPWCTHLKWTINSAHWEFRSIVPVNQCRSRYRADSQPGRACSVSQRGEGRQRGSHWARAGSAPLARGLPRGLGFSPPLLESTCRARWEPWICGLTYPGAPQGHLSILAFRNGK